MNVVARQSIKYSIVGYISVFVGIFSTLFIYPNDLIFAGKLQFLIPTAMLILPLLTVGIILANVRFFSRLSKINEHHNLLKFSFRFISINFLILIFIVFAGSFLFPGFKKTTFWNMSFYIFAMAILLAYIQLISRYLSIKNRIVVPNIFENVFPKIGIITAFILYYYFGFSEKNAMLVFLLFFVLALAGMFVYLIKIDTISFKTSFQFLKKDGFKKELLTYSYYTFFGSLGAVLALNIDTFMIGEFLSFSEVTIYNMSLNLVKMIMVPALGVYTISSPKIAVFIENNDMDQLKNLYKKTSLYLFIVGALFFSMIAVGIDDLFLIIKNGNVLSKGKNVFYIMGFALLLDLATGFNTYIIINSKYFKFNNYLTVGLAVLTIVTNLIFIFIFKLGIIGVAIATAFSLTVYNIVKTAFNFKKFGIHPFSFQYLYIIGFVLFCLLLSFLLPDLENNYFNLFYKPVLVFLLFILVNFIFKIISVKDIIPKKIKHWFSNDTP